MVMQRKPIKTKERIAFDFSRNKKQAFFYDLVCHAVAKLNKLRHFIYGGGIRGGKTFICLYIFWKLAETFPGSRWHIIREDNPALKDTTIPSMEKLIGKEGKNFVWKRDTGNIRIVFNNGSIIFFKSENLIKDKNLNWMLGLETNGIFLEQMEALSELCYTRANERIGSWYIDPMPIPILLGTLNPTPGWPKKKFYDKWVRGKLPENTSFTEALPSDNGFVTEEQWANWDNLDDESKNNMIKGLWVFNQENKWAYSFNYEKTVIDTSTPEGFEFMKIVRGLPVYLIFDFNVDPITCLVAQRRGLEWGKIINEYRLRNSDIYELIEQIKIDLAGHFLIATGDASGRNRDAHTKGNLTYVQIIKTELRLSDRQIQFPTSNPSVRATRPVCNSILQRHKNYHIASRCLYLIDDLLTIKTNELGEPDPDQKKKEKLKGHLLDNFRYFNWNYFRNFIKIN